MIFDPPCKCSHARYRHDNDEKCRPSCGCNEYRRRRGEPGESDLGEQFAAFADETAEWAEHDLAAGLERWPDDDWSGDTP